jgi:hypothetical protein
MNFPELAAQNPQLYSDNTTTLPQRTEAPQSWMVRVTDAKYHWYDLLAGFAQKPDLHPVGRYMRRMQFELDAAAEKRHLFFAVTRPRVRFDVTGVVQWLLLAQADAAAAGGGGRPRKPSRWNSRCRSRPP